MILCFITKLLNKVIMAEESIFQQCILKQYNLCFVTKLLNRVIIAGGGILLQYILKQYNLYYVTKLLNRVIMVGEVICQWFMLIKIEDWVLSSYFRLVSWIYYLIYQLDLLVGFNSIIVFGQKKCEVLK